MRNIALELPFQRDLLYRANSKFMREKCILQSKAPLNFYGSKVLFSYLLPAIDNKN